MKSRLLNVLLTATVGFCAGAPVQSHAQGLNIAQGPLFLRSREAPLNMLVVGRDHKLYYEAYNDASDLNGDGRLDIGYRGHLPDSQGGVTYFGYFDSLKCYSYTDGVFVPISRTANKRCSGAWSGDFLNYIATTRFDALRKVLYGGTRSTDTATRTVLERARIVQDAHSWGKEYTGIATDGYDIAEFSPLAAPPPGFRHLFAGTSLLSNETQPLLRVLNDTRYRIWNWVSIERPVADSQCVFDGNTRNACAVPLDENQWQVAPQGIFIGNTTLEVWQHDGNVDVPTRPGAIRRFPSSATDMERMFGGNTGTDRNWRTGVAGNNNFYRCGSNAASRVVRSVNTNDQLFDNNPFAGAALGNGTRCTQDNYMVEYRGIIRVPASGNYEFAVDGDDAIQFQMQISGSTWQTIAGRYGAAAACNCEDSSGEVSLVADRNYNFRFRHVEQAGDDSWVLKIKPDFPVPNSVMTDYLARVEVCNSQFPETNCRQYPNGSLKPTGLLHDYGERDAMMFGLISGSNNNNTQGGVLRKAVSSFKNEVDEQTGQFTSARGIVYTLDRFRILGFGGNFQHQCGWIVDRSIGNTECRPWGNPIGEMLFEAMRYWGGATAATPGYNTANATDGDDGVLQLPRATWNASSNPYAPGNFVYCAKPFNTIISDINPSYDTSLPGTAFSGVLANGSPDPSSVYSGTLPASLDSFDASALGQQIWAWEYGSSRNIFIGQSGGVYDAAPTPKTVASFGNIRGLSPEEPTKQGSYYSAMVAYYGRVTDINAATDPQNVQTFSVALASPLPRINFPVGSGRVTLVPFAKSVGGSGVPLDTESSFQPTNQIVDFYVERFVNTDSLNSDSTVNGGRPFATFRINYEDVEQGADHDMDMIIRYQLEVTAEGRLRITLTSEYAAGGIDQTAGYIISGTTADGIYLEIRDQGGAVRAHNLHTPAGQGPGYCALPRSGAGVQAACENLPGRTAGNFTAREFTAGTSAGAELLKDPLWYTAKYGGFIEEGAPNLRPDQREEWDANNDGNPDNYFLVTNALRLREQLSLAFEEVLRRAAPAGAVATNSTRVDLGGLAYQSLFDSGDWSGDLRGIRIDELGDPEPNGQEWSAAARLVGRPHTDRRIVTTRSRNLAVGFEYSLLTPAQQNALGGGNVDRGTAIVNWVRGDRSNEQSAGGTLRNRTSLISDILNSNPAVMSDQDFGYCNLPAGEGGCTVSSRGEATGPYAAFLRAKADIDPTVFVGANGGMLHAIDGSYSSSGGGGGREHFGFVPRAVIPNLPLLVNPSYNKTQHQYFVDGSPTVADAYLNSSWRSVLVGTTGAGGRSVFALDVTNPSAFTASNVLWELTEEDDPDIGFTIGRASIVKLQTGEWAAVFGNGYNSRTHRAMLFVVNLETGALIRKYDTGEGDSANPNGLGTPTVADTEGLFGDTLAADSKANYAYAGDMHGNLWRFDLSTSAAPVRLFTARDASNRPQNIVAAPAVQAYGGPVSGGNRGLMVYFGTGRFFVVGDNEIKPNDPEHAFYGIRDLGNSTTITRSQLVRQTINSDAVLRTTSENRVDYVGGQRGFWIDLSAGFDGERIVTSPVSRFGQIFFGTYAPLGGSCNPASRGFIMSVSPFSGIGTLQALGVNVGTGGAGLFVQSSSPVPPTLLVTDRYLLALTQIDPDRPSSSNPNCATNPNLPECVVSGASRIAIPRVSGRLSWKQLR